MSDPLEPAAASTPGVAPATPTIPPAADASPEIIVRNLSWAKILVAAGSLLSALGIIVNALLNLVYGQLQDRLTRLTDKTEVLENTFG